jgi:hypothetical protein
LPHRPRQDTNWKFMNVLLKLWPGFGHRCHRRDMSFWHLCPKPGHIREHETWRRQERKCCASKDLNCNLPFQRPGPRIRPEVY